MPWINLSDDMCNNILNAHGDPNHSWGNLMAIVTGLAPRIRLHREQEQSGGWAGDYARRIYGSDDVDFDDKPAFSVGDEGVFVMAWTWVSNCERGDA